MAERNTDDIVPQHTREVPFEKIPWKKRPFFGLITMPRNKKDATWTKLDETKARLLAAWTVLAGWPLVYHCNVPWPPPLPDSDNDRDYITAFIDCKFRREHGVARTSWNPWN